MAVTAVYKCPACEKEYNTAEDAENCGKVPFWPLDTRLALGGRYDYAKTLYKVHVDPRGDSACQQFIGVRKHPAFGNEQAGKCFIADRASGMCGYRPLTVELAEDAAGDLERQAEKARREARKLDKQAKVYREWLAEQATERGEG